MLLIINQDSDRHTLCRHPIAALLGVNYLSYPSIQEEETEISLASLLKKRNLMQTYLYFLYNLLLNNSSMSFTTSKKSMGTLERILDEAEKHALTNVQ